MGYLCYMDVDCWKLILIVDYFYDLLFCDFCVCECLVKGVIELCLFQLVDGQFCKIFVVFEFCVGCGVCEMVCLVELVVIVIDV